ncbi:GAF domain-containing protein [Paraliomyxa miuraensis]|uniref:GAF domain-containing protein n=1 Tax=Paraliomyxa miuraensis TaxID=376150 RepID=UPI0022543E5E|nr:GAF domain-containing protein [Paraliomyxa miuraensis]MCX4245784.1 GAF domain-containing protein [Paraliomyxa miuraensis]
MSRDEADSPSLRDQTQAFLHEFFVKGQELIRELIEENERLRSSMAAADRDGQGGPELSPTSAEMVGKLMRQVEALESEVGEIRRMAGSVQNDAGYRERLQSLEDEHYNLAAMYVASGQFHAAITVDEVLRTVTEILLNFVGVGAFTLYVVDETHQLLFPLWREGGDPAERTEQSRPSEGPLADAIGIGRAWRAGDPMGAEEGVLMHLPLYSGTRLVGVLRLESFLPQKSAFADTDFGLLELISGHSGIGIEMAWIRAHAKPVPLERQAIEHLVGG